MTEPENPHGPVRGTHADEVTSPSGWYIDGPRPRPRRPSVRIDLRQPIVRVKHYPAIPIWGIIALSAILGGLIGYALGLG